VGLVILAAKGRPLKRQDNPAVGHRHQRPDDHVGASIEHEATDDASGPHEATAARRWPRGWCRSITAPPSPAGNRRNFAGFAGPRAHRLPAPPSPAWANARKRKGRHGTGAPPPRSAIPCVGIVTTSTAAPGQEHHREHPTATVAVWRPRRGALNRNVSQGNGREHRRRFSLHRAARMPHTPAPVGA